jgi:hypothetical protein
LYVEDAVIITGRIGQDRDAYSVTIAEYHPGCLPQP